MTTADLINKEDKKLYIPFFSPTGEITGFFEILLEDYLLSMSGSGDYEHD